MIEVAVEAQPSVLETAAAILRTFSDRAPTSDRRGLHEIAERFEEAIMAADSLAEPNESR